MSTASDRLVTPCCGAPLLPRPFDCRHEYEAFVARMEPGRWRPADRCYTTERPREPVKPVPVPVPVQGSFGL